MHIPDGYLSPATCATFYAASVPAWLVAGRKVRAVVKSRYVPLVAVAAAFSFLVMMFNVPIPDGTTAHAVGAVLIAVLLGPWAAVIAVSTALLIQALFFGDGGVLAFGANAFNMAIAMPLAGYGVYRLLTRNVSLTARRRAVAAGIGGYIGLNVSALLAAVEFGLQPVLFKAADGTPLYAPFHLGQTVPAMMLAHLTVAGLVEAAVGVGVVTYLQRANLPLLRINHRGIDDEAAAGVVGPPRRPWRAIGVALAVLALLTPLGLLAPGTAFGERAPSQLDLKTYHLDAVPNGLQHYAGFWHAALFDGYDFKHDAHPIVGYLVSAGAGLAVVAVIAAIGYGLSRRRRGRGVVTIAGSAGT